MGLANLAAAKAALSLDDDNDADEVKIARLQELDEAVSRTFELKTGRRFGGTATPETRTVDGDGTGLLVLPTPVRSVSAVSITGTSPLALVVGDGSLASHQVALALPTVNGEWRALRRLDGGTFPWPAYGWSRMAITAVWADAAPGGSVPIEVTEAVTFVLIDQYRLEESSPAGEIGPEGMTIRPRNPWNFELVKTAIAKYQTALPAPVF